MPTPAHHEKDYQFSPDAMLPAWFVTDRELCVQDQNDFAKDLVRSCSTNRVLKDRLSLQIPAPDGYESLWECILDQDYDDNFLYIEAAIKVVREHFEILDDFNESGPPKSVDSLVQRLRNVTGMGDIVTSYIYFKPNDGILKLGVKITPPQGLKLQAAVELEGTTVEYVDVVMAYQLEHQRHGDKLSKVFVHGTQPAIHDVTMRHRLWEEIRLKTKEEEEARITQFLSHALKTPLANTKSILKTIKTPGLDKAVREERILELESLITDINHLVRLLLFINTVEKIEVQVRVIAPDDSTPWARFTVKEIQRVVGSALQSVHNLRTESQVDVDKIESLFERNDISVPSRDADGPGLPAYENLASALTRVVAPGLSEKSFALCPLVESGRLEGEYVSNQAKTVLLDLLLVELVVNAVKNADEDAPEVALGVRISNDETKLLVEVFNNGAQLSADSDVDLEAKAPGEKRLALGRLLNSKAARVLRWNLNVCPPPKPGTLFTVQIPIEK